MEQHAGILLENGTNELEIIEFQINESVFGINVLKVKEIIQPMPITPIPHSHPYVKGIIQLRGEVLPVVSLEQALGLTSAPSLDKAMEKLIVTEFNRQKIVFEVHQVRQILRISWEKVEKPSNLYAMDASNIIGVIKNGEQMIMLLDFEKIMFEINPDSGIHANRLQVLGKRERSNKQIVVAEDSPLLRNLLQETLHQSGYEQIRFFENGLEALQYLESIIASGKDVYQEVQLLITDIEMPKMDGHHLTRRIKNDPHLKELPIVIFSSLISGDLFHKGEAVGAVAQIAKPEIEELVKKIDAHVL